MELRTLPSPPPDEEVIWHEVECGGYDVDLPLWAELAEQAMGRPGTGHVLDVGAGSGRVALALAQEGHLVTAFDLEAVLLRELRRRARARGLRVTAIAGDARELDLERKDFALVIVPMQAIQLFGGAAARRRFLSRARTHMRPGALLACAIVEELEPFAVADGDPALDPDRVLTGGRLYLSAPTGVRVRTRTFTIERERTVVGAAGALLDGPRPHTYEASRLSCEQLEGEGEAAGLRVLPRRKVAETEHHLGSGVVVLSA
jgi:SAM-dependent methyltransferase